MNDPKDPLTQTLELFCRQMLAFLMNVEMGGIEARSEVRECTQSFGLNHHSYVHILHLAMYGT